MTSEMLIVKTSQVARIAARSIRLIFYFSLFIFHFSLLNVFAQDDDTAPPPITIFSKEERSRLDAESDLKSRTKLALEFMGTRLAAAERLHAGEDYDGLFRELGAFQGLMDNSLDYLLKRDTGNGKVLDNFKRLEIGLRGFGPRLETIRRDLPTRYEDYVRKLVKYVRDARSKAIDPQFADTVLPKPKSSP